MDARPRFAIKLLLHSCLLAVLFGVVTDAGAEKARSVTVRFPAFSISPGDRISGMKLKISQGRIHTGCVPNRWTCDRTETAVHCYTLHPTFALGISGMLPEMIISGLSDDRPSIEAAVEFIDGSGKEYSKDIRQDELIIR
ncbi:MAG: hypothetical protein OEW15_15385 [Nitrospirota bacterium]|nr:hypothetical protein [Nitrospirota bacterium]